MGRGGFARGARFAGVEQHDGLAGGACPSGEGEEARRLAELLDDHRDHAGVRIADQVLDIVLDAACGLVAGRDRERDRQPLGHQRRAEHHRHRP
jgi:hypothetical protein